MSILHAVTWDTFRLFEAADIYVLEAYMYHNTETEVASFSFVDLLEKI